jgi:hypothetical protein
VREFKAEVAETQVYDDPRGGARVELPDTSAGRIGAR